MVPSLDSYPNKKIHKLIVDEITNIIESFAQATELSIISGSDEVELPYLTILFSSYHSNEQFGGSDEKYTNLALQIC